MKTTTIILAATLAGCATMQRAETARRAQAELVGMPKKDLFACAGLPARSYSNNRLKLAACGTLDQNGACIAVF